ncbi:uncharacterized protein [Aristolochia californica]|uniref:uncharacterized protein n=1 Tax=Aristolochia californica TaxID=171875 RepID=UPI0035D9D3A2
MAPPPSQEASPLQKQKKIPPSVYFFGISLSLLSFSLVFLSFRDTKFWFLLSNAIIFFVVADSDAFSPKPDLYDEFLKHRGREANWVTSYDAYSRQETEEKKEKKIEEVEKPPKEKEIKEVEKPPKYSRSAAETAIVAVNEEKVLPRCDATRLTSTVSSEEDNCSGISDEELNRRVEEFIQRVNREIRLQDIRERKSLRV